MKNAFRLTTLAAVALIALAATTAHATETVSPGAVDRVAQVNNACPTFSWGMDGDAAAYEIIAYILPEDASQQTELTADNEALFTRVAGSATSWTPSAVQCFAPGGRYVWFVRAVRELAGDEVVAASEWSAGRYFTVPAAPSVDEVARALEVLQRFVAQGGDAHVLSSASVPSSGKQPTAPLKGGVVGGTKSVTTASAAIRGANPEYDVEAYGIVGVTNSVYGAGVAAANTEGGPDLVLDGSFDGDVNTSLYEWMLDRSSPNDETFWVRNTGGGTMTLDVYGTLRGTAFDCPGCVGSTALANESVTRDKIEYGGVSTDNIDFNAVTSAKIADGTIVSADLAEESVTSNAIEDGGISEVDIGVGAVNTTHIADGSIHAEDLAADAISGAAIADGSITTADLADGTVTSVKIQNGAVFTDQIDDSAVTADKIAAGAVGTSQLAFESVGENQLADEAVTNSKIVPGAVDSSALADGAVTGAKLGGGSVGAIALRNDAVTTDKIADSAVTGAKILNGSVTMADLAAESVGSNQIEYGGVDTDDINFLAVGTAQLADGAVTAAKLAPGAIGAGSLADGSVTSATIANGTIATIDLSDGVVTAAKLAAGAVQNAKLGPGAVTTDKLGDAAVTNAKLAVNSVTASRILDGSIAGIDLADGAVVATKLAVNAVTGSHIADGAVGANDLADNAVFSTKVLDGSLSGVDISDGSLTGADIADGSIHPVDVASGFLTSKDQIYEVSEVVELFLPEWVTVAVNCNDTNDIPIGGTCTTSYHHSALIIEPPRFNTWDTSGYRAQVMCSFWNESLTRINVAALIYCIDIP